MQVPYYQEDQKKVLALAHHQPDSWVSRAVVQKDWRHRIDTFVLTGEPSHRNSRISENVGETVRVGRSDTLWRSA